MQEAPNHTITISNRFDLRKLRMVMNQQFRASPFERC
jgi:hypothetical protein